MHEGVDVLLRDKCRPPGHTGATKRLAEIVRLTQEAPLHGVVHDITSAEPPTVYTRSAHQIPGPLN